MKKLSLLISIITLWGAFFIPSVFANTIVTQPISNTVMDGVTANNFLLATTSISQTGFTLGKVTTILKGQGGTIWPQTQITFFDDVNCGAGATVGPFYETGTEESSTDPFTVIHDFSNQNIFVAATTSCVQIQVVRYGGSNFTPLKSYGDGSQYYFKIEDNSTFEDSAIIGLNSPVDGYISPTVNISFQATAFYNSSASTTYQKYGIEIIDYTNNILTNLESDITTDGFFIISTSTTLNPHTTNLWRAYLKNTSTGAKIVSGWYGLSILTNQSLTTYLPPVATSTLATYCQNNFATTTNGIFSQLTADIQLGLCNVGTF